MRIDLHGLYIHNAWKHFNQAITEAYLTNNKKVHVITGQGAIMHEVEVWAHNHPYVKDCTQNPRNPGSFSIKLRKSG
jgi:DNA-nicking Smr family endonuclease